MRLLHTLPLALLLAPLCPAFDPFAEPGPAPAYLHLENWKFLADKTRQDLPLAAQLPTDSPLEGSGAVVWASANGRMPAYKLVHKDLPGTVEIEDVLSPEEASKFVAAAEALKFDNKAHPGYLNQQYDKTEMDFRRNTRCVYQANQEEVAFLFHRVRPLLMPRVDAAEFGTWRPTGLNTMWRFYRYGKDEEFPVHIDNDVTPNTNLTSWFSLLLYLSDSSLEGGETTYYRQGFQPAASVQPAIGSVVIFPQKPPYLTPHSGSPVKSGVKYILRTDVLYERVHTDRDERWQAALAQKHEPYFGDVEHHSEDRTVQVDAAGRILAVPRASTTFSKSDQEIRMAALEAERTAVNPNGTAIRGSFQVSAPYDVNGFTAAREIFQAAAPMSSVARQWMSSAEGLKLAEHWATVEAGNRAFWTERWAKGGSEQIGFRTRLIDDNNR